MSTEELPTKMVCTWCNMDMEPKPAFRFSAGELILMEEFKAVKNKSPNYRRIEHIMNIKNRYMDCRAATKGHLDIYWDGKDYEEIQMLAGKMKYLDGLYNEFLQRPYAPGS